MTDMPNEEFLRRLRRALGRLKPIQREVYLLSRADDLTYAEIGERLGIPRETVKRHFADALYNLDRLVQRAHRPWWRFW